MSSPRKVTCNRPSTYTGAVGSSKEPGREMPMSACFDSPGPFTTHPITATRRSSTPGWASRHTGMRSRRYPWISSAICWKNVEVVRPQPGQAVTCGVNRRNPSDCSTCCATRTSSVRSPPGLGVSDTRIVSPIPSASTIANPAALAMMPLLPRPASVSPRCRGKSQREASRRYTSARSATCDTFAEMMIRSCGSPTSSARAAERIPLSIIASRYTSRASSGSARRAFASIIAVSRSWSSEPQFTPMRTGLSLARATSTIVLKFSSRRLLPTLPGLMRYLASTSAQRGWRTSSRWPL